MFRLSEREGERERERDLPSSSILPTKASDCQRLQAERVGERKKKSGAERKKESRGERKMRDGY